MKTVTLAVELLIPDNTAFSASMALRQMGIDVPSLRRMDFYEFSVSDDASFKERIVKTDIIVNSNKHKAYINPEYKDVVAIVVEDREPSNGLAQTLKQRLGFSEVIDAKKGTLWLFGKGNKGAAEQAVRQLLHNPHYQEYRFL